MGRRKGTRGGKQLVHNETGHAKCENRKKKGRRRVREREGRAVKTLSISG